MTSKAFELSQLSFGDNVKAEFGSSNDLSIYHNGSDSWVEDNGTGNLYIDTNGAGINITYNNSAENMASFTANGAAALYYDSSKKFETSSVGSKTDQLFGISDSDTGIALGANGSNIMQFYTGNNERARLDASGNLMVGGTTAGNAGTVTINAGNAGSTVGGLQLWSTTSGTSYVQFGDESGTAANHYRGFVAYAHNGDSLRFGTAGSEKLRIDSGGALNGPSSANFDIKTGSGTGDMRFFTQGVQRAMVGADANLFVGTTSTAPNPGVVLQPFGNIGIGNSNANSGASFLEFRRNATQIGGVTQSGTTGVSYNTSSDYRLKENVTDVTDGITRVKQLAPKRFNFIADPETIVDGFLAHEAQAVVPEAVTGTHNEVDDDGNAVMQGIDQGKLVPLLTAALQEAITKIETLETKVAALESE